MKGYFRGKPDNNKERKKFEHNSTWEPPYSKLPQDTIMTINQINKQTDDLLHSLPGTCMGELVLPHTDNLNREDLEALKKLKTNSDIVIKSADKGGSIVVLDREAYILEALRQLNDTKYYIKLEQPIFPDNVDKINKIVEGLYNAGVITKNQCNYLAAQADNCRPRIFYLLPKIHKDRNSWPQPNCPAGRPIVSDCSSESYHISEYIDSFIAPLSVLHPAYLKDTYDFVKKVKGRSVKKDCFLVTGDVTSLYTNMNLDRVLKVVEQAFADHPDSSRPSTEILQLLEITLKNNDFTFNDNFYLQVHGTAMGKKYAPSLANLYLQYFDHMAMHGFRIKPEYYARFLDDIFIIWYGSLEELSEYNIFLNSLIPDIEITLKHSHDKVDFLDTTVYKVSDNNSISENNCMLNTKIYFKDTDTHQLLHTESFHPKHTTTGVLKSQVLRFKRISSTYEDYAEACYILFQALQQRGYSRSKLRKMKRDVWLLQDQPKTAAATKPGQTNLIPLVLRYNQFGNKFMHLWKNIINNNSELSDCRLVAAYSKNRNLASYLVSSKLKPLQTNGTTANKQNKQNSSNTFTACGSGRCYTCRFHASNQSHFQSTTQHTQFNFTGNFSCDSSNIIYLITCRKCLLQYVGETGRTFRERMTDHRSTVKTNKKTAIGIHFNRPDHSVLDIQAIAIEQIGNGPHCEISRKQRESFWQTKLGTKFPLGLNCMPID